jgi:hypothetical protein
MYFDYMLNVLFNVVQNTLVYIQYIGTPQIITKLQPNLQLKECKDVFLDEKLKS